VAATGDVRPILIAQPTLWHSEMTPELRELLWAGGVGSYFGGEESDYYTIEAVAEGIDVATRLPKNDSIFYDDMHFKEGGSQEVARLISTYLLSPEAPPLRR
jgi:hypothetical protein